MKTLPILILIILTIIFPNKSEAQYKLRSESLLKTVSYLASEELNGRFCGSREYFESAKYMAKEIKELELRTFNGSRN